MGLCFFVGEVQEQSSAAVKLGNEYIQHAGTLKDSVNHFLSAPLSSKTYDSARNYFRAVYPPLANALVLAGESLIEAHTKYPAQYQSIVGGGDTEEDRLLDQIQQGKDLLGSYAEVLDKLDEPNQLLEKAYMRTQECIAKLQERLDNFYDFNGQSAGFFSDAEANVTNLETAIAALGKGAWNASSGTFDLSRLDMNWVKPIQEKWKERQRRIADKQKALGAEDLPKNLKELHENYYWSTVHNAYVSKKTGLPVSEVSKLAYQFAQSDPESFKNPMLDYYNKLIATGVDPLTGRTLTEAEIANAKIMRSAMALQPIYFAVLAGVAQPRMENYVDDLNKMEIDDLIDVDGSGTYRGKYKGDFHTLENVTPEKITYTKRPRDEYNQLRREFNTSIRKNYLKTLGENPEYLKAAGFSVDEIARIKAGDSPVGWQVHHQLPLDDSGTNDFSNFVLIKDVPYHKVLTNFQTVTTRKLKVGESLTLDWLMVESPIYPLKK